MTDYILPLIDLLNEMSPYLLLGFFIAGILHEFVPQTVYRNNLSKGSFRSVLLATLFGIPLPLCSCGVLPTAISLRREGVSKGATTAFLISTPQTGVDSIIATASIMGIPFAIMRPLVAFFTSIIGGCLVNRFCKDNTEETSIQPETKCKKKSFATKCIGVFKYAFVDMLQDIGKWILIGLGVAALITVLVPDDFFTAYSNIPIVNMLIVLSFSAPMYLCATGSIPIAAALMMKGLSPGAALVLLMAGPATNIAAMLLIDRTLGRKNLIIYLLTIISGAIAFGLIIDYILPTEWFITTATTHSISDNCCDAHATAWWKSTSSILFAILLSISMIIKHIKPKNNIKMQNSFKIKGMMCNHCKENVERNIAKIEGVTEVRVELSEGVAYVNGNFEPQKIIDTIKSLGYEYVS